MCITLGREALTNILGDHIQVITFRNQQKWALEKSPILKNLTKIQVEKILDAMKIVHYKAGDVILRKGSPYHQKIVAVIEGNLKKVVSLDHISEITLIWLGKSRYCCGY